MDVSDLVRAHYGGRDLETRILDALTQAGVDISTLTVEDLASVDQLHAGFLPATRYLLAQLDLTPDTRLLDVGCGIGGPARAAAAAYGCPVTGIDLSADFVRAATVLTERVGLGGLVQHQLAAGDEIPVEDASFDRAMMIHVGMNIPDKASVFAEVRRALVGGGIFGLYEQMEVGPGPLTYPLPWAEDERSSFVESAAAYQELLSAAGFEMLRVEDRTAATAGPPGPPPRLSPAAVFGPGFGERIGNNINATRSGRLAPMIIMARAG